MKWGEPTNLEGGLSPNRKSHPTSPEYILLCPSREFANKQLPWRWTIITYFTRKLHSVWSTGELCPGSGKRSVTQSMSTLVPWLAEPPFMCVTPSPLSLPPLAPPVRSKHLWGIYCVPDTHRTEELHMHSPI